MNEIARTFQSFIGRRLAGKRLRSAFGALLAALSVVAAACAPVQQTALRPTGAVTPGFHDRVFTSFDGARLGLNVWRPEAGVQLASASAGPRAANEQQELVIVGVHGMNDYAGLFNASGPWWARQGVTVYAYDQRGFGRSPNPGVWPDHEVMREDLRTAVEIARRRHPDARIAVVAESMGAALAMTAFGSDDPPDADILALSAPGLRGWGALPALYKASLWLSAHVRPGWIVRPPRGVQITPTDNTDKLIEMWEDENVLKDTRIDAVYGVVSLMEEADAAVARISATTPVLFMYGANDEIILPGGVERTAKRLPKHVRTAYYTDGYHMLLNDLQAETVWRDVLAFMRSDGQRIASDAPELPWVE